MKTKVLFICSHNTARSQMAAALLEKIGGEDYIGMSAGVEAGVLNSFAVDVLKEENIDISSNKTNKIIDFFKQGLHFHYVITVCDESKDEKCPVFPGLDGVLHWSFDNPALFEGNENEKFGKFLEVKNSIKEQVEIFVNLTKDKHVKDGFPLQWHVNN